MIWRSSRIPLDECMAQLSAQQRSYETYLCGTVLAGTFGKTSAPLERWARAIANVATHAQASGIHVAFPKLVAGLFGEAMAAGYGREEASALYKVLRWPGPVDRPGSLRLRRPPAASRRTRSPLPGPPSF